jgi:hypothetical protein
MTWLQKINIHERVIEISRRFPVVLVFAIATTLTLILTIDDDTGRIFRWPLAGFIGFLAALGWSLFCEAYGVSKKLFWTGTGVLVILLGIYYSLIPTNIVNEFSCFWVFTIGLSAILHFFISIIPFLRQYDKPSFVNYNISLFISWMQSALYAILLYTALSVAILALDKLFDMQIKGLIYFKLFIFITGLFQTTLFLSDIPNDFYDKSAPKERSVFKVIVFYLFIPVTILYGLIVYAYFIRVMFTSHKMVDWAYVMTLWYFGVGLMTWLLSAYFDNHGLHTYISGFRKWFFPFSIFPAVLLFLSLNKNIQIAGIREEFYFSALVCAFIAVIMIYFLYKLLGDLRLIPGFAIGFCVIGFWSGPISICSVPVKNQQKRLISDMQKAGMLKKNVLNIDSSATYVDSAGLIFYKLQYLDSRHALGFLKDFDKNNIFHSGKDSLRLHHITPILNLNRIHLPDNRFFEFQSDKALSYNVDGYEKIIPINTYNTPDINRDYVKIENNSLILYANGEEKGRVDVKEFLSGLASSTNQNNTLKIKIANYDLMVIILSATGFQENNGIRDPIITGYALIKDEVEQ